MIPLAKGHGLGNDYLVIEERHLGAPLSTDAIVKICDRNRGVGSEGILPLVPTARAEFGLRIFDPDGRRRFQGEAAAAVPGALNRRGREVPAGGGKLRDLCSYRISLASVRAHQRRAEFTSVMIVGVTMNQRAPLYSALIQEYRRPIPSFTAAFH